MNATAELSAALPAYAVAYPSARSTRRALALTLLVALAPVAKAQQPTHPDTTCDFCKDFYRAVNKTWLDTVSIPADQPAWGPIFSLNDRVQSVLQGILRAAAADTRAPHGSRAQKLGAFYASCLDTTRADADGVKPIAVELARIDAMANLDDLETEIARLQRRGSGVLFTLSADVDARNSKRVVASVGQGGLGLPNREYYVRDDSTFVSLRRMYVVYVAQLFALAGEDSLAARADADSVLSFETALARASMDRIEARDPIATYRKMSLAGFRALAPGLSWDTFARERHVPAIDSLVVRQSAFMAAVSNMLTSTAMPTWRTYLRARLLVNASSYLSTPFRRASFAYRQRISVRTAPSRARQCVSYANSLVGDLLGRSYAERAFPPAAKARMEHMVANLRAALAERIQTLDWMSEPTKHAALAKLASFRVKVGYPDRWRDYAALDLDRGSFIANVTRIEEFESDYRMATIGHAPDLDEWSNPPQTVDAFAGAINEIVFPAGILQPFSTAPADDPAAYGAIGALIGHEMTHHFDDRGRLYDAQGNLRDWWAPADAAAYAARTQLVVDQFNGYTILDSVRVDGRLTLSENIADLGGLRVAYEAMRRALKGHPRRMVGGYTPEQQFFLAYARGWALKAPPEWARDRLRTDSHAPWPWRVNGPLSNLPEFAAAFACKDGDPMVRPSSVRAQIW